MLAHLGRAEMCVGSAVLLQHGAIRSSGRVRSSALPAVGCENAIDFLGVHQRGGCGWHASIYASCYEQALPLGRVLGGVGLSPGRRTRFPAVLVCTAPGDGARSFGAWNVNVHLRCYRVTTASCGRVKRAVWSLVLARVGAWNVNVHLWCYRATTASRGRVKRAVWSLVLARLPYSQTLPPRDGSFQMQTSFSCLGRSPHHVAAHVAAPHLAAPEAASRVPPRMVHTATC